MFARLKSFATATWHVVKDYVVPNVFATLVSAGKVVSSAGQTIFILPKAMIWYMNDPDYKTDWRDSIGFIISNVIITSGTRVPAIFRRFNSAAPPSSASKIELKAKGKTIYLTLSTLTVVSGMFASLSTFLNSIKFGHYIDDNFIHIDHDNDDGECSHTTELVINSLAITFTLANLASFAIYNVARSMDNARIIGKYVDEGKFPWKNRQAAYTIGIAGAGVVCTPLFAYLSTSTALEEVPYVKLAPGVVKKIARGTSFVASLTSQLMTNVPAVYRTFTGQLRTQHQDHALWETPYKVVIYTAGAPDTFGTFISGMVGAVHSIPAIADMIPGMPEIDSHDPALITAGVVFSTSSAALYYLFNIHEAAVTTIQDAHSSRNKNRIRYHALSQQDHDYDVESNVIELNTENKSGEFAADIEIREKQAASLTSYATKFFTPREIPAHRFLDENDAYENTTEEKDEYEKTTAVAFSSSFY